MLPKVGDPISKPLTAAEERRLWEEWQQTRSPKVRDRFVFSTMGYVVSEARGVKSGAALEDLVQAGLMGAVKAFDKFDASHGVHFGTYAIYWIRAEVWRVAGEERSLLSGTRLRGGDRDESAKKGVHTVAIDMFDEDRGGSGYRAHTVPKQLTVEPSRDAGVESSDLVALMAAAGLTDNERAVIERRWLAPERRQHKRSSYGARSLSELAADLKLTKERVRQIEASAVRKMRRAAGKE